MSSKTTNEGQSKEYDKELIYALNHFYKSIDDLKLAIKQIIDLMPDEDKGTELIHRLNVIESEVSVFVSLSYPGGS